MRLGTEEAIVWKGIDFLRLEIQHQGLNIKSGLIEMSKNLEVGW